MTGRLTLRGVAKLLGGEIVGQQALCPGPGHSPRDRSLAVCLSPRAPDGFVVHSHAGDDFRACRDHVRERLGLPTANSRWRDPPRPAATHRQSVEDAAAKAAGTQLALRWWSEGVDPRRTVVERYLNGRALKLDDDLAGDVLRWHRRMGAMLALFRNIETGEPQAICRTFLDREGKKLVRKFLGPVWGAAIMLDPFENVLGGLHIGEGVETCMAARQYDLRPTWALGSASAIAAFPVLDGVERLTLLKENDSTNTSPEACETCAARWHAAEREVFIITPRRDCKDLNDVLTSTFSTAELMAKLALGARHDR